MGIGVVGGGGGVKAKEKSNQKQYKEK